MKSKEPNADYEQTIPKFPCIFCEKPTPIEKWHPPEVYNGISSNEGYYVNTMIGKKIICDECLSRLHSLMKYGY